MWEGEPVTKTYGEVDQQGILDWELFIKTEEREASRWSWKIENVINKGGLKITWKYDGHDTNMNPPSMGTISKNVLTTKAQTEQIKDADKDLKDKIKEAKLKDERDSWDTSYDNDDHAIYWMKKIGRTRQPPPDCATKEEKIASMWRWKIEQRSSDNSYFIRWSNTIDSVNRPFDIANGEYPPIVVGGITEQAQHEQQAAAESALKALASQYVAPAVISQSAPSATQGYSKYGIELYKDWINGHNEDDKKSIRDRANNQIDPMYYFKTNIAKIKSGSQFIQLLTTVRRDGIVRDRIITNRDTFINNLLEGEAVKIGQYFKRFPITSGGSSKTMKNHLNINKKTRKNKIASTRRIRTKNFRRRFRKTHKMRR